jgi:hypothetical protein
MSYSHVSSWWWTEEPSKKCRVSCQNKFVKLVRLVGFIINLLRCTVTWTWKKYHKVIFNLHHTDLCHKNNKYQPLGKKFKLPRPCRWGRLSSAILFGVGWCFVSGKRVGPNMKNQAVRIYKFSQNFGNTPLTNTSKYSSSKPRLVLCSVVWDEEVYLVEYSSTTLSSSHLKCYTTDKVKN